MYDFTVKRVTGGGDYSGLDIKPRTGLELLLFCLSLFLGGSFFALVHSLVT